MFFVLSRVSLLVSFWSFGVPFTFLLVLSFPGFRMGWGTGFFAAFIAEDGCLRRTFLLRFLIQTSRPLRQLALFFHPRTLPQRGAKGYSLNG